MFKKHGRRGWPHARTLWVDATSEELLLRWMAPGTGPGEAGAKSTAAAMADGDAVSVGDVTRVTTGQATDVLRRSGRPRDEGRYLSLHLRNGRTLDLEAATEEERQWYATGLHALLVADGGVQRLQAAMVQLYEAGAWVPQR